MLPSSGGSLVDFGRSRAICLSICYACGFGRTVSEFFEVYKRRERRSAREIISVKEHAANRSEDGGTSLMLLFPVLLRI